MNRATDLCTCGKTREEHADFFDLEKHTFFPNPQPYRDPPPSVEERVIDLLTGLGETHATLAKGGYLLTMDNGEVWEVQVFKRTA